MANVLCLSGFDPTGGAGVLADAAAIQAAGAHAVSVLTALTVQDTRNVRAVMPVDLDGFRDALETLIDDVAIDAVKIGLLGDAAQLPVIVSALLALRVPVVCDPVLSAGGGANLVGERLQTAFLNTLLPQVDVLTPNAAEARRLVPNATRLEAAADALLARGARRVLVTGGDEPGATVENLDCAAGRPARRHTWPRLAGSFHGAGCTLASAIAARLALGLDADAAILEAQRWTRRALASAFPIGGGRLIPNRAVNGSP